MKNTVTKVIVRMDKCMILVSKFESADWSIKLMLMAHLIG